MARRGWVLLALAALTASACGGGATSPSPTPTAHVSPSGQATAPVTPTPAPAPTATTVPTPKPTALPSPVAIATEVPAAGGGFRVALTGFNGSEIAALTVPASPSGAPPIAAGPGAVYVASNARMLELTVSGRRVDLGSAGDLDTTVYAASGAFAVSPDGQRWSWSTYQEGASNTQGVNRLWVAGVGEAPHVIAERNADASSTPAADTPGGLWHYQLLGWTQRGIVVNRQPWGLCGCGDWFEEKYNNHTAFVDPSTGHATAIADASDVALGSVAADSTAVMLRFTGRTVDRIWLLRNGVTVAGSVLTLSGTSDAGAAVFDPARNALLYATIPSSATTDPATSDFSSTLRVADMASGDVHALGPLGLRPMALLPDGSVLAVQISRSGAAERDAVVAISPAGAVRTVMPPSEIPYPGFVVVSR